MHFAVLDESILGNDLFEFVHANEEVVLAVDLSWSGLSGRVWNAETEFFWITLSQLVD